MAPSTNAAERRRLGVPDTDPRPVPPSLWLLATVALAGLAVLRAGQQIDQAGADATAGLEAAQLMELADRNQALTSPGTAPFAPTIGSAPSAPPAPSAPTPSAPTPAGSGADVSSIVAAEGSVPDHVAVGRAALDSISYPWERLLAEWTIEFLPGTDGLYGLTLVPEQRIEIYVRADQSPGMVAHVVAHEMGHAIDVSLNDGTDRRRWSDLRGLGDAPWWPDSGATDFSTGAGDFAESFAAWQVGPAGFRSTLATPPDGPEIELLAELSAG